MAKSDLKPQATQNLTPNTAANQAAYKQAFKELEAVKKALDRECKDKASLERIFGVYKKINVQTKEIQTHFEKNPRNKHALTRLEAKILGSIAANEKIYGKLPPELTETSEETTSSVTPSKPNQQTATTNTQSTAGTTQTAAGAAQTAAGTSQTAAGTIQTASRTTQTAAGTTHTAAGTTQTTAGTTHTAAGTSQTAAGTTQTAAGTTQTAAGTTQTAAGTTETAAGTTQTAAGTTQTAAGTTQTAAGTTQTAAGTTETAAGTTHTAAGTTQTTAGTTHTAAGTSQTASGNTRGSTETGPNPQARTSSLKRSGTGRTRAHGSTSSSGSQSAQETSGGILPPETPPETTVANNENQAAGSAGTGGPTALPPVSEPEEVKRRKAKIGDFSKLIDDLKFQRDKFLEDYPDEAGTDNKKAYDAICNVVGALEAHANSFTNGQILLPEFKNRASQAAHDSKNDKLLKEHRGTQKILEILANIVLFIGTLGIGYLLAAAFTRRFNPIQLENKVITTLGKMEEVANNLTP